MSEKQFDATPQRREKYRKEGRYAKSRDASSIAATAAVLATLVGSRPHINQLLAALFSHTLGDVGALTEHGAERSFQAASEALLAIALPVGIAAAVGAGAVGIVQAGIRVDTSAIGFKPERLNPLPKLQQLFSPKHGLVETAFAVLRIVVVGYIAYRMTLIELPNLLVLGRVGLDAAGSRLVEAVNRVVLGILGGLGVIAGADYAQSKYSLEQEMKMTREEIREEMRQAEGDAKAKGRMRARARALSKARSIKNVRTADVVVVNPTHISVALRYGPKDAAPVVVAKGHDDFALQIRAEARKHGIPILENRPLARALDAEVKVGKPVPAAHFTAVARILAFVYRIKGRRGTRRA